MEKVFGVIFIMAGIIIRAFDVIEHIEEDEGRPFPGLPRCEIRGV